MLCIVRGLVAVLRLLTAEHLFETACDIPEEFGKSIAAALLEGLSVVEHIRGKLSHLFNIGFREPHTLHVIVYLGYARLFGAYNAQTLAHAAVLVLLNAVHL